MRTGTRGFFLGFFCTLAAMLPLTAMFLLVGSWQRDARRASQSQSSIPVVAGAQNVQTLMLAVAQETPAFLLVRLDSPAKCIRIAAVPAQSVVRTANGSATLAECYAAAGPARAAQLLGETLDIAPGYYLAATPAGYGAVTGGLRARLDTARLLTPKARKTIELDGTVAEWTAVTAETALASLGPESKETCLTRAAWCEAFVRQNLSQLPGLVENMRAESGSLLTNLTAESLYALADTLEYLESRSPTMEYTLLPGNYTADGERYEFDEDTLREAQLLLG